MQPDKIFTDGMIVSPSGRFRGDIGVKDGKILYVGLAEIGEGCEVIHLGGNYILPGPIDAHVHFQDPGITHREDLEHGSAAAAMGGITTCISHPLNIPPAVDAESYRSTLDTYAGRSHVDYALHGGGTADNIEKIKELWQQTGATSLKIFMCFSVAEFPFVRDGELFSLLQNLADVDGVAIIHAENEDLVKVTEHNLKAAGRKDPRAHVESRPAMVEIEAVRRVIFLLEKTKASAVILHVSSFETLHEIRKAQQKGVRIWAETCPHFLTFTENDIETHGPYLKFTPVMRDEGNRIKLWELLDKGYIDTIGSDHCPYTREEKEQGLQDIWKAANGLPGLETLMPVLLDGVNRGFTSLEKIAEVTSIKPANIYGLAPRKGALIPGSDCDFVVVDMDLEKTYEVRNSPSKCDWSPYDGMIFKGWPVMTVIRGEVVADLDGVKVSPGYGQYIPRKKYLFEQS